MDLTINDLTNDLFQNFPLKSKKIGNDHFVLLKATIFLTLPCLPMPSATHASFIHKSLLLRLPCVALRKEAWACSLKHLNLLLYSPTRHWTTHIHPCGPMSLASLVMSSWSVLMTRASNNLWWGKEIFQALPEWARSSQGGRRERRKNMYSWPENSHENLVLPPTRTSFHLILQS